jgi:2-polyprenyl-3-methyl-5-hydroxy-6-metoxy-1,4-benzoquinol methylase
MQVCEICGTSETTTVVVVDGLKVGKCRRCGLVYVVNPTSETELQELYTNQYFLELGHTEYSPHSPDENLRRLWLFNEQRLDAIDRVKKPGSLLDAGCGPGYFMVSAQSRGWRVKGFDISSKAAAFARTSFGLNVTEGSLENLTAAEPEFDLIAAWQVLEHTPLPLRALLALRKALKPDGLLVVEVPNLNSLPGRLKGNRFNGFAHPRFHRYYFTHASIHNILKKAEFRKIAWLNCRYRDGAGFRSGVKSLAKQSLGLLAMDSFVTVVAGS